MKRLKRGKSKESYAEKYFRLKIKKYFRDIEAIQEYPIGIFYADFAWPLKKKMIEIDGKAHLKKRYTERDKFKDRFVKEEGWKVMRIKFTNLLKNTEYYIKRADNFIGPKI